METLHLAIDGMTCNHCVRAVAQALNQVEGVEIEGVTVGRADLRYDPALTSPEVIDAAIDAAGYVPRPARG
jgi:copper chaperone CopZ